MSHTTGIDHQVMTLILQSRWTVLTIAFLARVGIGFQFIAVAALMPQMQADLLLSLSEIGVLLGIFMVAGVFLSLPGAMIANRLGDRFTLQLGLSALALAAVVLAASGTFAPALAGRILGGVGAVLITVTAAKILTDWFAGRELATAMGVLGTAWPVGIALGLSALPFIDAWRNWQVAMYATAIMPALAVVLVALLPTASPAHKVPATASVPRLWSIRAREFWIIVIAALAWPLMSSGGYVVFSSYAPGLLIGQGVAQTTANLTISLLSWLIIVTIPIGGYFADRSGKGDRIFWAGCLVAAAAITMVPFAGAVQLWVILSAALGFTVGPVMALPGTLLPPESRATGFGIFYTIYYLGTVCMPTAAGWLLDTTGSTAIVIWYSAACLAAAPLALGASRLLQRRLSRQME
jgi:predicted MFS family arabinose efflux permease